LRCNDLLGIADQPEEISSEGCSTRPPGPLRLDAKGSPAPRHG
jgi:hypothetical protein